MAYNWKEFFTFAENIHAAPDVPGPREAALRSAVSRAYYAAFRASLEVGVQNGFSPTRAGEDHNKIREHFRTSNPKTKTKQDISADCTICAAGLIMKMTCAKNQKRWLI